MTKRLGLARAPAAVKLAMLAGLGLAAVLVGPAPIAQNPPERSDIAMYKAVVERLRAGAPYHETIAAQLRARHYATQEIFNWRTPLHLTLVASMPASVSRATLVALAIAVSAGALAVAWPAGPLARLATASWFLGISLLDAAPDLVFMSETWAGLLIGLSLVAFALGHDLAAVALGLAALLMRELAAPYCVACTLAAVYRRHFTLVALWSFGAVVYGAYYGWHLSHVLPLRLATDLAHGSSWVELGGLPFVLATLEWSGWLFVLPAGWHAAALVCMVAGLLSRSCPSGVVLASAAYFAWLAAVGKPFDHYWGLIAAPAWGMALGFGPGWVWQQLRSLRSPSGGGS